MMTEALDLKLTSEACRFFKPGEASVVGGFCSVKLAGTDPRLSMIAEAERQELLRSGCGVVLGWNVERHYTRDEINNAQLFRLITTTRFQPTGEECGTEYDLAGICPICGAGRVQRSELVLDLRKLPKRGGIAVSLGGEIVVSHDVAELLIDEKITGFVLRPVRHRASKFTGPLQLETVPAGRELISQAEKEGLSLGDSSFYVWLNRGEQAGLLERAMSEAGARDEARAAGAAPPIWYQLVVEGPLVAIDGETRFGINPLNDDPTKQFRCPRGHTAGLSVVSEVFALRASWDGRDICFSDQLVGYHPPDSLIYPEPLLLVSQRFRAFLEKHKIKGFKTEVARLVPVSEP